MLKRNILRNVLAVLLCMTLMPISTLAVSFSDTESHWAGAEIEKWKTTGIIQGFSGEFRPDDPITRGEMAVILDRLMIYYSPTDFVAFNPFTDLSNGKYYSMPILRAYRAGVMFGDGSKVRPQDNLTREEAITMLCRAFYLTESVRDSGYADKDSISPWAAGFVNTMTEKGYVSGYMNKLNPKANITRAEIVKILDNSIAYVSSFLLPVDASREINGITIINFPGVWLKDVTINGDLIISPGSASLGGIKLTNVSVNGNMSVCVYDRIEVDGSSYIESVTFEKIPDFITTNNISGSVLVLDDATVVEKAYSKVKYPYINIDVVMEYAPGIQ